MNSVNRRTVLLAGLGVAGAGALAVCTSGSGSSSGRPLPGQSRQQGGRRH
ncbi:hypothetical protein [Streptomyces sp. NPDC001450]